mmetsp:Transcript_33281/g.48691  ORF Transcript_33281/g.48691 Transcript_33281/m.48691 type:complete len:100 (-) Transcript_33281:922-1221(-)
MTSHSFEGFLSSSVVDQYQIPAVYQKLTDRAKLNKPTAPPTRESPTRFTKIPVRAPKLTTRFTTDFFCKDRPAMEYNVKKIDAAISAENVPKNGMRPPC